MSPAMDPNANPRTISIRVPASTANLGAGYDTLGMALTLYLTIKATHTPSDTPLTMNLKYTGQQPGNISLDPKLNLITSTMMDLITANKSKLTGELCIRIDNAIPLSRGLGSSASAICAAAVLANWVAELHLTQLQIMNYCTAVEGHPDNVACCLMGGFCCSVVPRDPAVNDVLSIRLPVNHRAFRMVAVVPDYSVPTHLARSVLPTAYSTKDVVHSIQRAVMITHALGNPAISNDIQGGAFHHLLDDVIHQTYRSHLIPGFEALQSALLGNPTVLGSCISGAGPTVLVFTTPDVDLRALSEIIHQVYNQIPHPEQQQDSLLAKKMISVQVMSLDCEQEGVVVTHGS